MSGNASDTETTDCTTSIPLVLIVDDDRVLRMQLRLFLEQEGYKVTEALNGEEALALFVEQLPDLVLLDAKMPVMDGFTCCTQIRALPTGDHIPILMITGLEDRESVDRAFAAGSSDYITKPIHWAVMRQRVRRLIQQSQLYEQLEATNQRLEAANAKLQRLALADGLTQVANRRHFDEYLDREWRRMAREGTVLSLLLCDVDCFKAYNDTYGHLAGDSCLQRIAEAIATTLKRPADLVARYGGEEFAVVLPNTDLEGAAQLANEICTRMRWLNIPHSASHVSDRVTVSIGVTSLRPQPGSSFEALIAIADAALYQAKTEGRDRTVIKTCD